MYPTDTCKGHHANIDTIAYENVFNDAIFLKEILFILF